MTLNVRSESKSIAVYACIFAMHWALEGTAHKHWLHMVPKIRTIYRIAFFTICQSICVHQHAHIAVHAVIYA